jgi:hypothetical protein
VVIFNFRNLTHIKSPHDAYFAFLSAGIREPGRPGGPGRSDRRNQQDTLYLDDIIDMMTSNEPLAPGP